MTNKERMEARADLIIQRYQEMYGETLVKRWVTKTNDTAKLGIMSGEKGGCQIICYLSNMPDDIDEVQAAKVMRELIDHRPDFQFMERYDNFEKAKDLLFVKLLNTEQNQKRLRKAVRKEWNDLSMVLYLHVPEIENSEIMVKGELFDRWDTGMTVEEMLHFALVNAEKNFPPAYYQMFADASMSEPAAEPFGGCLLQPCKSELATAACFLYPSVYQNLVKGDVILPSSTEECIIFKHRNIDFEIADLLRLVNAVNHESDSITPDIYLSDHVYEYLGEGKFQMH